ncbi:MAG: transporter [Ilumatobacteraceae bacterium]|nr:transporter [Ilumatobacteraceae bacterium]
MTGTVVLEGVGFAYGRRKPAVLDGVSWRPGRVAALLGPNGAGKSTLFALACGVRRPRSGQVLVDGRRVRPGAVAWMPQTVRAMPGLRAREQVALAGWMQGSGRAAAWSAARTALEAVDLLDQADVRSVHLSGGQLRRLGIAEVLSGTPSAILLDEPTVGLDPVQRTEVLDLIGRLGQRCQVIVATHLVDDLATAFDSVGVLARGSLCFAGSVDEYLDAGGVAGDHAQRAGAAYRHLVGARPPR